MRVTSKNLKELQEYAYKQMQQMKWATLNPPTTTHRLNYIASGYMSGRFSQDDQLYRHQDRYETEQFKKYFKRKWNHPRAMKLFGKGRQDKHVTEMAKQYSRLFRKNRLLNVYGDGVDVAVNTAGCPRTEWKGRAAYGQDYWVLNGKAYPEGSMDLCSQCTHQLTCMTSGSPLGQFEMVGITDAQS